MKSPGTRSSYGYDLILRSYSWVLYSNTLTNFDDEKHIKGEINGGSVCGMTYAKILCRNLGHFMNRTLEDQNERTMIILLEN